MFGIMFETPFPSLPATRTGNDYAETQPEAIKRVLSKSLMPKG
jgi:hypothetical protein